MKLSLKPLAIAAALCSIASASALNIVFDHRADLDQKVIDDFQTAANTWASYFSDDVTMHIHIDYQNFGSGFLGEAGSSDAQFSYNAVKNALMGDAKTARDNVAVSHLQSGNALQFLINHTAENGNSGTTYLDNNGSFNNMNMDLSTGNAKALGLIDPHASGQDADIEFNSFYDNKFVFGRNGSFAADSIDFTSVCLHEIGHAMGFFSGADGVDENSGLGEDNYTANTLDLFRLSGNPGAMTMDISADKRQKFFSFDGGATTDGEFSTGVVFGNGWQASHWQHHEDMPSRVGIMDPRAFRGGLSYEKQPDIDALDVIGWDNTRAVPEPCSMLALGLGAAALIRKRRK